MSRVKAKTPLRIRSVQIEGNKRTDSSVFEDELQEAYRATTVEGVHRGLLRASHNFERLGIFQSVDMTMEEAATKGETDVLIKVKEKRIFSAYTGTSFTRDDVNFDASGSLKNATGFAETIRGIYSRSRLGSRSIRFSYSRPRIYSANVQFDGDIHEDTHNRERTSSLREKIQGLGLHWTTHSQRHRLSYEMALRDIIPRRHLSVPYAYDASLSIMREAHPSLKSAIRYKFVDDQRNDRLLPTDGSYFSGLMEVAGIGLGDTAYVKAEVTALTHATLLPGGISGSLGGTVGVVKPMGWRTEGAGEGGYQPPPKTCLSDRYFMGGISTLRGFGFSGIGPRAPPREGGCIKGPRAPPREGGCIKGDSLGGDLKYILTASLSAPVPLPVLQAVGGLRGHLFADAGNLLSWSAPLKNAITDVRVAVGAGLALNLGVGRIELNYTVPLRMCKQDFEQRWQFGLAATL